MDYIHESHLPTICTSSICHLTTWGLKEFFLYQPLLMRILLGRIFESSTLLWWHVLDSDLDLRFITVILAVGILP